MMNRRAFLKLAAAGITLSLTPAPVLAAMRLVRTPLPYMTATEILRKRDMALEAMAEHISRTLMYGQSGLLFKENGDVECIPHDELRGLIGRME